MNILFRADSSSQIGTGHIMRDLVLAKKYCDHNVIFASQELPGNINHKITEEGYQLEILKDNSLDVLDELIKRLNIDMIIIDHYGIDYIFEQKIKEFNPSLKIFVLDDTYEKHYCDVLLNHNIYANRNKYKDLVPQDCELRCGSEYTLLRDEFIEAKKQKYFNQNEKFTIFIAMGGSDVLNLNPKILKVLEKFENIFVYLITTSANVNLIELEQYAKKKEWIKICLNCNNVAELISKSNFAIITPSVTANEVFYMGLPILSIKVADNQNFMMDFFKEKNIQVLEKFDENILYDELNQVITKNKNNLQLINFVELSLDDKKMILEWRNHPDIKKWMYNQEDIKLDDHLSFIESLKQRDDKLYFLVKQNNENIGVIDFIQIIKNESVHMGLYANPSVFGKGKILINEIINYSFNILKVKKIISEVFVENKKAYNVYVKFNFHEISRKVESYKEVICMELKNEDR